MIRLIVTLSWLLGAGLASWAAAAAPVPAVIGKNGGEQPQDFVFRMGETLKIRATGELADQVAAEWAKTRSVALYFDGVHIADLKSPPQRAAPGGDVLMDFPLVRDAEDEANRTAWDSLFTRNRGYLMTIEPALGLGGELPLVVQSAKPLRFYVASASSILLTLGGGLIVLAAAFWYLVTRTKMLFDEGSGCFSLGKSQMAFWGLVVLLSFVGVWILTGTMERIPPQVLVLLGVSGATGLGAVVIGGNKKSAAEKDIADKESGVAQLQVAHDALAAQQATAPDQPGQDRLAAVRAALDAKSQEIAAAKQRLEPGASKGFWRDICDDGNGLSFHRLQVVVWTLVLGAVFIRTVAQVMSMPEFSETLLSLMGISNATYLGFKIPEKQ